VSREQLEKQRAARVARASMRDGIREGHFRLGEGWVRVWLTFYPKQIWYVCDTKSPGDGGADIDGTIRKLDDETKSKLEEWL
jgi:hypothetical protein